MTTRIATRFIVGFVAGSATGDSFSSKVHALSTSEFQKGAHLIDAKQYNKFPRAYGGRTPVYLPEGVPIVLKQSRDGSDKRLEQMDVARKICQDLGATHLIIPEARRHGDFLIEERLPLMGTGMLEQMGLYLRNKEKFTQAIRELTAFLLVADLTDLMCTGDPFTKKAPAPVARFDNIPLYLENGEGKIGLIDLEHLHFPKKYYTHWSELILYFPYHFDDILEVVREKHPDLSLPKDLEENRNRALQTYEMGYIGHQHFLDEQKLHGYSPSEQPELSAHQQTAIGSSLKGFLEGWYNYGGKKDRFNYRHRPLSAEERQEMSALVDQTVPAAISLLRQRFQEVIARCPAQEDPVECRSFMQSFPEGYGLAKQYLETEFRMEERNSGSYADEILVHLLTEMKNQGAIYDYIHKAYGWDDVVRV